MKSRIMMWSGLLLLAAVLVGCGAKLMQAWTVSLGEAYVHALWVSSVDQHIHVLKVNESNGARIERFDADGQQQSSVPVATSAWTGAHLVNPQDDSLFLLERISGQALAYHLLHQRNDGGLSRVAIDFPPLPEGQRWEVDAFKSLTSDNYPVIAARIMSGNQTQETRLLVLSPEGNILGQFTVLPGTSARLLKLDSGFAWVANCATSALPGSCVMRFMVLDDRLQVISDSQSMHGEFSPFASVSRLGEVLVVGGFTGHWVVDLTGNVVQALQGLDGYAGADHHFYASATGVYALLNNPAKSGYNLCRLNQDWQTQWCNFISETAPSDLSVLNLDESSLQVAVDDSERFHFSFLIERIYSGVRGSFGPVPAAGVGLAIELMGTRDLDVHHLRYAPDGRKLASAKEASFSEFGWLSVQWWVGVSLEPETSTAGVCNVARTATLPEGGLLALNHFCDADGGPYTFELSRWD